MKVLFGLKADSYDQLPCIEIGSSATPEEIRDSVIEDFLRMHKASPPITSANEATRCEFISAIIYGVASIFDGTVKVYPQYEVSGSHGKGPIDWVIKMGDVIISVTEAKREDINQGVAQSTVQAHASMQCNRKKRTYDDADLYEGVMYCIVSTGVDWVITKVQSGIGDGNDNGDGNPVEVFLCSPTPTPLPINYPSLSRDDLVGPIEKLFGQIKWVFDQQKSSLVDGKRVKTE